MIKYNLFSLIRSGDLGTHEHFGALTDVLDFRSATACGIHFCPRFEIVPDPFGLCGSVILGHFGVGSFRTLILVIPEEFNCNLTDIQTTTFFGHEWKIYAENFDPEKTWKGPCNNGTAERKVLATHRFISALNTQGGARSFIGIFKKFANIKFG